MSKKVVPKAGIEPARGLMLAGFSCHYNFRYQNCLWSGLSLLHRIFLRSQPLSLYALFAISITISERMTIEIKASINYLHYCLCCFHKYDEVLKVLVCLTIHPSYTFRIAVLLSSLLVNGS